MSPTVKIDSLHPDDNILKTIVQFIATGKTIAFPTETFYALGASAYHEEAIGKIFTIKGRDYTNPLPIIVEGETMLEEVVSEISAVAASLIREFWPGGLTLILRASPKIPPCLTGHTETVAVRNSSHPIARMLVAGAGCPITATSANLSGQKSCSCASEVEQTLGNTVDLIVDGGTTEGVRPSTIVDLTSTPPKIVREGIIPTQRLYPFIG